MRQLLASDLIGSSCVWLLEVDLGGTVYRFSSQPIEVLKDGAAIGFSGGLAAEEIEYEETIDRGGLLTSMQSLSVEVVFPFDVAQARKQGRHLSTATAEVSLMPVRSGTALQPWAGRYVVTTGPVSQAQIGSPSKPSGWAAFSIAGDPDQDRGRLVQPEHRISAESVLVSWGTDDDQVQRNFGRPYPVVVGRPGVYRVGGTVVSQASVTEGSPAYGVSYNPAGVTAGYEVILIAGHHVACSGGGNLVHVKAKDLEESHNLEPVATYDKLGRPITIVNCPPGGSITTDWRNADEYWVSWGTSLQGEHTAHRNPFGSRPLHGAGDVLRFLLSKSTIPIDHAAFATAAPYLNALARVSTYYNDPECTPMEAVEELLELLPVSIRRGPDGLYPIVHDQRGTAGGMIELHQGRELTRVQYLQDERRPGDIATIVSVEYTPRASEGSAYLRSVTVGIVDADDLDTTSTVHSRAAALTHPNAAVINITADLLYDAASAASLARRRVREASRMPSKTAYRLAPELAWLPLGIEFSLTDADLHLTDQTAEIVGKSWDGAEWTIDVLFFEDVARDRS